MRGITETTVNAFLAGKAMSKGNSSVSVDPQWIYLELHGSKIARRENTEGPVEFLWMNNCGYTTNTTKERLNGLGSHFGVNIWQHKFEWYWSSRTECKSPFASDEWVLVYCPTSAQRLILEVDHGR